MKYTVYTDAAASLDKGLSGCGYCILTDDMYIASDSIRLTQTTNPTHAEVVSIGLVAACLIDEVEVKKGDEVVIFSDSSSAIEFCENCLATGGIIPCSAVIVVNSIKVLRRLGSYCTISFEKVHGHKDKLNPNTFVDRLAKLPIRRE